MTTSPQTATLLPLTVPFSERLSETWLLERTYHAHLRNGRKLSVPDEIDPLFVECSNRNARQREHAKRM